MKKELFKNLLLLAFHSVKLIFLVVILVFGVYGMVKYFITGGF
ncbi:MAG: hypothetical protein UIM53_09730 [Acutalibacteraceae bacterium]|nr:hypothetical protein [Acutalibacteraceae bacterium]